MLLLSFWVTTAAQDLTEADKSNIILRREQEKMARDVYALFHEKWNQHVFQHISESEEVHMQHIKQLLDTYTLQDPVAQSKDQRGVFRDAGIQKLYDSLVASGTLSLEAALRAGALVEEKDIKELQEDVETAPAEDMKATYRFLLRASQNHLRAFVRHLRREGVTYTPVLLSKDHYADIVGSHPGMGRGSMRN